jgi:hypothetical protein
MRNRILSLTAWAAFHSAGRQLRPKTAIDAGDAGLLCESTSERVSIEIHPAVGARTRSFSTWR